VRPPADVTLILEGTYPYVAGGVSSWVHQILGAYPDRRFALLHIGPQPGAYSKKIYEMPKSVVSLDEIYCRGETVKKRGATFSDRPPERTEPSRVLEAIRRLHLDDTVDDALIADLASGDLTIGELLHGGATFELLRRELYERLSPEAPFMDFFWHFRAMHVPLLRMLNARCPPAAVYHAVSCGYAGLIGAVASFRDGAPLVVTEHGLYARERELELSRATWIRDVDGGSFGPSRPSPLRRFWSHYFQMLSKIAYHRAAKLVTLSEANRAKQLADGADGRKIMVVPNGVNASAMAIGTIPPPVPPEPRTRMRVGFVGRVVPIKDVVTLIRAIGLARYQADLEVWIVGPEDEDKGYAQRCRTLVDVLRLGDHVKFLGPQKVAEIYPQLDAIVLTSISEGQPLVILEAYAAGLPVISSDVGACRELIEGGDAADKKLGHAGLVTRVANPADTAAALVKLAKDPDLRVRMGRVGRARVSTRYQLQQVLASYDTLYDVRAYDAPAEATEDFYLELRYMATDFVARGAHADPGDGEAYLELRYLPPATIVDDDERFPLAHHAEPATEDAAEAYAELRIGGRRPFALVADDDDYYADVQVSREVVS
jgi:glycosyltransferase involved in cell wall biosynthesis